MVNVVQTDNGAQAGTWADWRRWLQTNDLLSPGLPEGYRRRLEGFDAVCRKRARTQAPAGEAGAAPRPTVGLAREYVELQRLERAPGPAQLQEWKEALNWLFRRARCRRPGALTGVPPLGRADMGRTDWERRLVEKIRVRHMLWRTEQSHRGWAWRLARFLGERPVEAATERVAAGAAEQEGHPARAASLFCDALS